MGFRNPRRKPSMPFIHVRLFEGRSQEQKRAFVEAVTRETARTLNCPPEAVDIVFDDVKRSDWASGGKLASDPK
jgi:4-oxalocrotonate tautomerase